MESLRERTLRVISLVSCCNCYFKFSWGRFVGWIKLPPLNNCAVAESISAALLETGATDAAVEEVEGCW